MLSNYIVYEIGMMIVGLIFLGPRAIQEAHEPWFSLWLEWAELHKKNDFNEVVYNWDTLNHHPVSWYDAEFEQWLDENGFEPYKKENFSALCKLEKYLIKHHLVKRQCYWNHWIYQINTDKLF